MRIVQFSWKVIVALALSSCIFGNTPKPTTVEPNPDQLVGDYFFKFQTLDHDAMLPWEKYPDSMQVPKISLRSNATYEIVNFPVFDPYHEEPIQGYVSRGGNWSISDAGTIGTEKVFGIALDSLYPATLLGSEAPYMLEFMYGDPDANRRVVYQTN